MKKTTKMSLSILIMITILVLVLTGCGRPSEDSTPGEAGNEGEKIVIKVGHTGAPDHYYQDGLLKFAELVDKKTNGRVEIQVYPSDQLGGQRQELEGCMVGTHDMVLVSTMIISNFDKSAGVFDLPFIFSSRDHAFKVLDGEIGKEVSKQLEESGVKVLAYWENGFRHITNSKVAIKKPEDLKGLKIRVPESPVYIDTFTTLGAAATPMAFGEVFSALQLGTVDGQENPAAHVIHNAFYEVQKYLSLTRHFYTAEPLVMSKALFDKMPEDVQKALFEAAEEARDFERKLATDQEADFIKQIKEKGMTVIEDVDIAAFQEAVVPVYDKYKQEYGDIINKIQAADN